MRGMSFMLGVGFLAGCSLVLDGEKHTGGDAGTPDALGDVVLADTRPAIRPEELCQTFAAPYCEARQRCCATAPESMAMCVATFNARCTNSLGLWVLDEQLGYDELAAFQFKEDLETASGMCEVEPILELFTYDVFDVLGGTRSAGAVCTPSLSDVRPALSCAEGVCLNNGLLADWTCGPPRPPGGSCFIYTECNSQQRCQGTRCGPRVENGAPCAINADCESLFCERPGDALGECSEATADDVYCGPIIEFPDLATGMMDR